MILKPGKGIILILGISLLPIIFTGCAEDPALRKRQAQAKQDLGRSYLAQGNYAVGLKELLDAAKMDGAGEWRCFFQIAVPLSTPALATIGLFTMLGYWNDFYTALLYIDKWELYPIQYLLWTVLQTAQMLAQTEQLVEEPIQVPILPMRMAMVVIAIVPIAFGYLFVQRYLVRGIRLGSLKG